MDLAAFSTRSLALAERLIADLETRFGAEAAKPRDRRQIGADLSMLMRASATLIKEQRALEKDVKVKAAAMTLDERRRVVLAIIQALPPEHRTTLKEELGW